MAKRGLYSIDTEPNLGIGQRLFLLPTGKSNLFWDGMAMLDEAATWMPEIQNRNPGRWERS